MRLAQVTGTCLPVLALACSVRDGVLGSVSSSTDALPDNAPAIPVGDSTHGNGCDHTSPIVTLNGRQTCTARLAANRFSNALCSCGDLQLGAVLTTSGFDSRQGPYRAGRPGNTGAAVAINGNCSGFTDTSDIGGSLSIAGPGTLQFIGTPFIRGDFHAGGDVSFADGATIVRNGWLGGTLHSDGLVNVGGDFHHSGPAIASPLVVRGIDLQQPTTVARACPCDDVVDVAALVEAGMAMNDNERLGIAADRFAALAGDTQWAVSCGQVYLSGIGGIGNLSIRVDGMSAIYVDGSINLAGNLAFDIVPGAEVDVFVRQDLVVTGTAAFARQDSPASGRIWVGGSGPITLTSPWIGNLYAPHASVGSNLGVEVFGSIFARDFHAGASATLVFDRAILDATTCAAPPEPAGICTPCGWCFGGTACMDGLCGSCQTDSDCCSLSICANGTCEALLQPLGS